jgi:nucleoid DNA-binding protein
MKKPEIASRLARCSGVTKAEAADQLDRVVHDILAHLKKGRAAPLPGLGKFKPREDGGISFESETTKGGRRGGT